MEINVSAALIAGAFCFLMAAHILEMEELQALLICLYLEPFGPSHPQISPCPLYCPGGAALTQLLLSRQEYQTGGCNFTDKNVG